MNILVTGSEGFLGSEIIKVLKKKKVLVFGISKHKKRSEDYNLINYDLLNYKGYSKLFKDNQFDILIHCAWYTNPKYYLHSKENIKWLKISKYLIDEFYKNGGKQFIGIGTNAEFPYDSKNNKIPEKKFSKGAKTLYGISKSKLNYYLIKNYRKSKWIRIFWLFGKNEKSGRFFYEMVSKLKKNKKFVIENPLIKRDYISTRQAAKLIVDIIFKKKGGQSFNVCNGKSISLKEIARVVKNKINKGEIVLKKNLEENSVEGDVKKLLDLKNYKNYSLRKDIIYNIINYY